MKTRNITAPERTKSTATARRKNKPATGRKAINFWRKHRISKAAPTHHKTRYDHITIEDLNVRDGRITISPKHQ
ncbi:MAG: hypothetical protein IPJ07_20745 [Acidobacteria bacterium]|nr:hypothetical protein [Acidobacteriota bacterium]